MYKKLLITGYKLIILQLILLIVVSMLFGIFGTWHNIPSVILGGMAWIIPNVYFVAKVFKNKNNTDTSFIAKNFIIGEGIKLLLSIILIILIILLIPITKAAFLSGYIATIAAIFAMPFLIAKK